MDHPVTPGEYAGHDDPHDDKLPSRVNEGPSMDPLEGNGLITENNEGDHEIWEKYFKTLKVKKNIESF